MDEKTEAEEEEVDAERQEMIEEGDMVERKNENVIDAWKTGKVKSINDGKVILDYCPPHGVVHTNNPVPVDELKKVEEIE